MNAPLAATAIPRLAPRYRFQWEAVQGCHVLLYPEGMVQLSASAGEILKRCTGAASVAQILAELHRLYPGAALDADVHHFLQESRAHGWLIFD